MVEWPGEILGRDPKLCPFCGQGRMVVRAEFEPVGPVWMWLWASSGFRGGRGSSIEGEWDMARWEREEFAWRLKEE